MPDRGGSPGESAAPTGGGNTHGSAATRAHARTRARSVWSAGSDAEQSHDPCRVSLIPDPPVPPVDERADHIVHVPRTRRLIAVVGDEGDDPVALQLPPNSRTCTALVVLKLTMVVLHLAVGGHLEPL